MAKYEDRWYQTEAADALWEHINKPGCAPVIAVPTGAGKTVIMGKFIKRYLEEHPHNEVLVLSHTKKILEQDIKALESFLPDHTIGAYSASLDRKEHEQITVGGIQSVVKNPDLFKWTNLVIVDEVHKVSHKNEGSYRKLLDEMKANLCGMSATIFRTGHGYIHKGKDRLFNTLAYDLTSVDNYNRLVEEGYLSKMIAVEPKMKLDSSNVKKSAGDYNVKSLAEAHDKEAITEAAIQEALHYGKNYKKWLVFAIDIDHAEHIVSSLISHGIDSSVIHSRTRHDERLVIRDFTEGKTRALVSVEKITTGFDAPNVDLILMLRPTMSAVLHVQMAGRGTRPYQGKDHCLYLDYAGNTARLGPINNPIVPKETRGDGTGEAPTKTCPNCGTITYTLAKTCESCNHVFVFESKLQLTAGTEEIVEQSSVFPVSKQKWLTVTTAQYTIHKKVGRPDSLLVTYRCGITRIQEWICVEHPGFAGVKGRHILKNRGYEGPMNTRSAYVNRKTIKVPTQILVDFDKAYPSILNSRFE